MKIQPQLQLAQGKPEGAMVQELGLPSEAVSLPKTTGKRKAGVASFSLPGFGSASMNAETTSTAKFASDSTFRALLLQLEAVHFEETRKLRVELASLASVTTIPSTENSLDTRPSPRASPKRVQPTEGDSRVRDEEVEESYNAKLGTEDTSKRSEGAQAEQVELHMGHSFGCACCIPERPSRPNPSEDSDADITKEEDLAFLYERFSDVFLGSRFEMCVVALLLLNILLMASQLQYHGYKIGYMIGIYSEPAEQYWPHFEEIFFICDFIFALLFTVEMLIRLCHIRCLAFCKQWLNWIDVIVVISFLEKTSSFSLIIDSNR